MGSDRSSFTTIAHLRVLRVLFGLALGLLLPQLARAEIPEARLQAAGVRVAKSQHLTLYTDVPATALSAAELRDLATAFDAAYATWCEYFGVDPEQNAANGPWRATGHIMKDAATFRGLGLWQPALPDFNSGYSIGAHFWMFDQPESPYYRRHLMLHEGVHGFMSTAVGGFGPPWYMEGMAELLGTHALREGKLIAPYFPATRDEVPRWGRINAIQTAVYKQQARSLDEILAFGAGTHLVPENYAWCFAAAAFLEGHPRYQKRFRSLAQHIADPQFNVVMAELYRDDLAMLRSEFALFIRECEYGYDFARASITLVEAKPLPAAGAQIKVAADRGWQSTGVELAAGQTVVITAQGRFQLAKLFEGAPKPWISEPNGISFRYHQGHPLGLLLAAVVPTDPAGDFVDPFQKPERIGLKGEITAPQKGVLFLRLNDSPSELADNEGEAAVEIRPAP